MASDVFSLVLHYTVGPQPAANVLHFKSSLDTSTDPDTDASELIDAFIADIQPALLDCLPSASTLLGYKAKRVTNGGGPSVVAPVAGAAGTRVDSIGAGAIGPCLIWGYFTGVRWRAGRTFLPGVAESDIDNNVFSAGLLTACEDLIALMLPVIIFTTAHAGAWQFGIYSRTAGTMSGAETGGVSGKPGVQNGRMKPAF